jgi:DNA invertase Pin-like site-specific DNA recombinase
MRAVAVVRVSTDEQAEHGVSLDQQRAKIEAYCSVYEIDLVAVEVDAGLSAKNLNRPGLQRALAMLKRGEVDALIVAKLDRLTRRTRDLLDLVERHFADGKRVLLSVHEKIDTSSAAGRMILTVLGALAQFEREQIADRVRGAMAHLAAQGKYTGGIPYGHRLHEDGETVIEDEHEQTVIATARELRGAGMSLRSISESLATCGYLSRAGKPFTPSTIATMVAL